MIIQNILRAIKGLKYPSVIWCCLLKGSSSEKSLWPASPAKFVIAVNEIFFPVSLEFLVLNFHILRNVL